MSSRAILVLSLAAAPLVAGCTPEPLRIMSFNIRFGTAPDGLDRWEVRRPRVVETIAAHDPDILGCQEALAFQMRELQDALPHHACVGVGRDDGAEKGEAVPIYYRKSRFILLEGGHIWLSDKPAQPGSVGWDAALPRMATWVKLRVAGTWTTDIYVINTHFDHRGEQARLESARLLRRTTDALAGRPIILLGDFNCGPNDEPHLALTRPAPDGAQLRDSFRLAGGNETGAGTYHAFDGVPRGDRIDWILCNRLFEVLDSSIDRRTVQRRYPSDHFPVAATLRVLPTGQRDHHE